MKEKMINKKMKKNYLFWTKILLLLALPLLLDSCSSYKEESPASIELTEGIRQLGLPGEIAKEELLVEVYGPPRRRAFDMQKKRYPVADIRVKIEAVEQIEGAASALDAVGTTDKYGLYRTKLRFGEKLGDQYLKVSCPDYDNIEPVYFYMICGVEVSGNMQQVMAGDELPQPIQVRIGGRDNPQAGVPVFFKLAGDSDKAKLSEDRVITNDKGVATTRLVTKGEYTGRHEIMVEIDSVENKEIGQFRVIMVTAMSLSRAKLLIEVLGGLALFIYGMILMSDGLQQVAGNKLRNFLRMFTGNKLTAVMAGAGITALIQSSSACSVMVVGFVNAGLLNLNQAIGVLLGSTIGTTITAQMVSFKLEVLAVPAIFIGVVIMLFAKKSFAKGISYSFLGFGLLFFGMMMMSSEMKIVASFPSFKAAFQYFDCSPVDGTMPLIPVLGSILIGTIMTMIVQSSSATIGLTIVMAQNGLLNFYTAVPLILGENIGTTVTGLLAAWKANRTAKEAAVAATIFKSLGVLIMVLLLYVPWKGTPCFLYLVNIITSGDVFAAYPENIGRHLASAHTMFNIFNVIFFLPLIGFIAWLSKTIIPDDIVGDGDVKHLVVMEHNLLTAPSAALGHSIIALLKMTELALEQVQTVVNAFVTKDQTVADQINEKEAMLDLAQHDIIEYLVKLTRRNLSEKQYMAIPVLMHCVNDVERIGDRAVNIFELINSLEATQDDFSPRALLEIKEIEVNLSKCAQQLIEALYANDYKMIDEVIKIGEEISGLAGRFEQNHEVRLRSKDCSVENGVIYVELLANLDRISAHLVNVAERANVILDHKMYAGKQAKKIENLAASVEKNEIITVEAGDDEKKVQDEK